MYHGWIVVAGAFTVLAIAYGVQFSFGVFLPAMEAEPGWGRAALSAPYALFVGMYSGLSYPSGRLTDRFGPRAVVWVGAMGLASGYALLSTTQARWEPYLYLTGLAAIGASAAFVPCNATVIRWFAARRGLALGLASSGISFAAAVGPLVAAALIGSLGWRPAMLALAIGGGLAMAAAGCLLVRDPESHGLEPDGGPATPRPRVAASPSRPRLEGWTLAEARASAALWILVGALFLTWLVVFVPLLHVPAHALGLGLDPLTAAGALSAIGWSGLVGRIGSGLFIDRLGRIPGVVMALLLQVGAFLGYAAATSTLGLYLASIAFGFAYSTVTVVFPALLGDYFGRAHVGAIAGFVFALGGVAAAAGPYLAGLLYDATGAYDVAFVTAAVLNSLSLLLLAFLRRPGSA